VEGQERARASDDERQGHMNGGGRADERPGRPNKSTASSGSLFPTDSFSSTDTLCVHVEVSVHAYMCAHVHSCKFFVFGARKRTLGASFSSHRLHARLPRQGTTLSHTSYMTSPIWSLPHSAAGDPGTIDLISITPGSATIHMSNKTGQLTGLRVTSRMSAHK